MEFVLDTHTHTIASGHAYSTIQEMIQAGKEKGLKLLGISEHAPDMPGSCKEIYFSNLHVIPSNVDGIEVIFGAEANVKNYRGELDISQNTLCKLSYGIASLHTPCIIPGTKSQNTAAYLHAMENPYINIVGHPDDSRYMVDYKELVKQAKETNVLLEVNNTSLSPASFRQNAKENYIQMLALCAEAGVSIIVSSDAHISYDVGDFSYAIPLLQEVDFPVELIANTSIEKFKQLLNRKPRI